jgi:hypothetical protein
MSRVFISYAHEDYEVARRLYNDLVAIGYKPWLDALDLIPSENWARRIEEEIRACKYFLAVISTRSLSKRGYVQKELRLALEVLDEIPIDERFLIPVRLDECRPKDSRLKALQWVDLFPDYRTGLERLLQSLMRLDWIPARLYSKVGIEVPSDIETWKDERLFGYIDDILRPEAINRAERDYEGIEVADRSRAVEERAREKLEQVAHRHGFVDAWYRYLETRRRMTT